MESKIIEAITNFIRRNPTLVENMARHTATVIDVNGFFSELSYRNKILSENIPVCYYEGTAEEIKRIVSEHGERDIDENKIHYMDIDASRKIDATNREIILSEFVDSYYIHCTIKDLAKCMDGDDQSVYKLYCKYYDADSNSIHMVEIKHMVICTGGLYICQEPPAVDELEI